MMKSILLRACTMVAAPRCCPSSATYDQGNEATNSIFFHPMINVKLPFCGTHHHLLSLLILISFFTSWDHLQLAFPLLFLSLPTFSWFLAWSSRLCCKPHQDLQGYQFFYNVAFKPRWTMGQQVSGNPLTMLQDTSTFFVVLHKHAPNVLLVVNVDMVHIFLRGDMVHIGFTLFTNTVNSVHQRHLL